MNTFSDQGRAAKSTCDAFGVIPKSITLASGGLSSPQARP